MKRKIVIIISIVIVFTLTFYFYFFETKNKGKYKDFEELTSVEIEKEDYTIHTKRSDSGVLLMAIHGGGIEPGTTEIIKYLAEENNYSYYSFNGIKKKDNQNMHITSTNYDESQALKEVANSSITLSFHGYSEHEKKHTYIGGLDKELAKNIKIKLKEAGFSASDAPKEFDGKNRNNIVNKNKQKKGVQLELSTAQRKAFFQNNDLSSINRKHKEDSFYEYTKAIEEALKN